jgi:hypothetical protein
MSDRRDHAGVATACLAAVMIATVHTSVVSRTAIQAADLCFTTAFHKRVLHPGRQRHGMVLSPSVL